MGSLSKLTVVALAVVIGLSAPFAHTGAGAAREDRQSRLVRQYERHCPSDPAAASCERWWSKLSVGEQQIVISYYTEGPMVEVAGVEPPPEVLAEQEAQTGGKVGIAAENRTCFSGSRGITHESTAQIDLWTYYVYTQWCRDNTTWQITSTGTYSTSWVVHHFINPWSYQGDTVAIRTYGGNYTWLKRQGHMQSCLAMFCAHRYPTIEHTGLVSGEGYFNAY